MEATEDDTHRAFERAVAQSGYSLEELEEQARTGRYENIKARLAWVAIGDQVAKERREHDL